MLGLGMRKCQWKRNLERAESRMSHRYGAEAIGKMVVISIEMVTRGKD